MRTILLGICILVAASAFAQRECAVPSYLEQQKLSDPALSSRIQHVEEFISNQPQFKEQGEALVIRIPVVVHVIYNTVKENISDEQIFSQIEVLNRDFRKRNADTANTPERFRHLAADVQIEFVLATSDPDGRATTGIIRKQTTVSEFGSDDKIKFSAQGGNDAWDSRQYLNIWVGDLGRILGYASVPGSAPQKDGIAINYTAFGTMNTRAPYHLGRTAVHEAGHWLGLRHLWGDTYCGTDLVDDTPKQGNFTSGCPTAFRSSCNNGSTGDMYMNFMDYTSDACVNLFTEGQKQRMRAVFNPGGPRQTLLASKGLDVPWNHTEPEPVVEAPIEPSGLILHPNPASAELFINFQADETWIGEQVSIISTSGLVVQKLKVQSRTQRIDISMLKPGLYFLHAVKDKQIIREKFVKL